MIFNHKHKCPHSFSLNGEFLDGVKEIAYLGILLCENGNFDSAKDTLYKKGLKSLYKMKNIISPLPKISKCIHLFNHMVKPVLLYGCEVWSYSLFGERNIKNATKDNIE